ncbi:MAG: histidine phosphatase family protein [Myxococcota bacterium]
MAIILLRHGRVDYGTMSLNATGTAFAEELKRVLSDRVIGRIISMAPDRCVQTVAPLAASLGTHVQTVSSVHEIIRTINESDWGGADLLVTFQYAVMSEIFSHLRITPPATRDDAYGTIWTYDKANRSVQTIDTGLR